MGRWHVPELKACRQQKWTVDAQALQNPPASAVGSCQASNTITLLDSAKDGNELNRFISMEGSLTNAINFIVPIFSALVIYIGGYEWSFLSMLLVSLVYFWLASSSVSPNPVDWSSFKHSLKHEKMSWQLNIYGFMGAFASRSMVLYGSILLILVSVNELHLSLLNAFSVLLILGMADLFKRFPTVTVSQWNRITIFLAAVSLLIVLLDWSYVWLIVFQALIFYLSRFVEMSLPFKEIRRRQLEGKVALTYKREVLLTFSKIGMSVLWYVAYHYVELKTLFLLILVSALISLVVIGVLGKYIETNE